MTSALVYAQKGTITGKVIDESNGEPLLGVNVYIAALEKGVSTDLDGKFYLEVEPGTYSVLFSYIFYQKKTVSDVVVTDGKVTTLNLSLLPEDFQMEEVTVSAKRMDNNEIALLQLQKRSLSVQDGISAQEINKVGFTNSAESMKQVTGATCRRRKIHRHERLR